MILLDPLTRDGARRAAEQELSRRAYDDARPALLLRLVGHALRALRDLLDGVVGRFGDGPLARVLLLAVLAGLAAVVLVRLGPLSRSRAGASRAVLAAGSTLTAAQHRAAAQQHADAGRWAEAVRERLRAVVRDLESRGVLDPRPGRTADEVARDAGSAVPALATDLRAAATVFDEVWYGGRTADEQAYAQVRAVDERLRSAAAR